MTRSIDALILTDKAYAFSDSVDSPQVQDIQQGLWQLRHNPDLVDELSRHEIYSGEIYIKLGHIAHALSRHELPDSRIISGDNPLGGRYMRLIDEILPERTASLLPDIPGHDLGLDDIQPQDASLYTHDYLVAHPELIPEFTAKDALARTIIANRRRKEDDMAALEPFHGRNASHLLNAAIEDLDLIGHAFRQFY